MAKPHDPFETFFDRGGDEPAGSGPSSKGNASGPPPKEVVPSKTPSTPDQPELKTSGFFAETASDGTTDRQTPAGPLRTVTGLPSADPLLASIGERLVAMQLLTSDQWNEALARSGTTNDLEAVLEVLRKMPSLRRHRLEPGLPALTAFQADAIREGRADRLRLGPYLFIDQIGAGGMGEVYKAWNTNLDRIEALKLVTKVEVTGSSVGIARFEREARVLAQLHHPCITTIYNTGRENGSAYIAMEYVRGRTLVDVVREAKRKGEPVPEAWALEAVRKVASALEHAHGIGVIHRDIKPNNIMIADDGEVRVLDMGIARLLNPEKADTQTNLTRQVAGLGTPEVMPPEQWADASSVSPASDIYSLGCTLYYLLASKMPFTAESLHGLMSAHLTQMPAPLRTLRPELAESTDHLVAKMLAKEPADRFGSCKELIEAMEAASPAPAMETGLSTRVRRSLEAEAVVTKKPATSSPWLILGSLLLVAGTIAGVAYYLTNTRDYAQEKEAWLVTFQKANLGAWPTMESLRAALHKGSPPKVESEATFGEFKEWMHAKSEEQRRHRGEFYTWAQSWQEQKSKVWKTRDDLFNYFENDLTTVSSKEDLDVIRKMVEDETVRRETIRRKARMELAALQDQHQEIFPDKAEIEEIASKAVPIDEMTSEEQIEQQKKAVELAIQERWKGKLDSELALLQTDHRDVWKNPEAIRAHLDRAGGLAAKPNAAQLDQVRQNVLKETWRRRANYWLTDFQKEKGGVWKTTGELLSYVGEVFPGDIEDESSFTKMQEAVLAQTRQRVNKTTVQNWSVDFAKKHPSLGPLPETDEGEFAKEIEEAVSRPDGKEVFDSLLLKKWADQIASAKIASGGNRQADFQNEHLLRLVTWLEGLEASGPAAGKVELSMELDGQAVQTVPLETKATLTVRSSIAGYVTVIVLQSNGGVFAFEWDAAVAANQKTNVVRYDSESPGEDQILCFVTEKSPRSMLPAPAGELKIGPKGVPEGFLEKIVLPPVMPAVEDIARIRAALPKPEIWDELIRGLHPGPAADFVRPTQNAGAWGKGSMMIRWGNEK